MSSYATLAHNLRYVTFSPVLFHVLGIESWAATNYLAVLEAEFEFTQTPTVPAYIPGLS